MRKHLPTQGGLVVALFAAYITIYLVIIPPLQGFDSVAHFNYINYLRQFQRWPAIDGTSAAYSYEIPQQPPLYYTLAAGASAWLPFDRADQITRSSDNPYQMTLSPLWTVNIPEAPQSWHLAARISQLVAALGGLIAVFFTYAWAKLLLPAQPRIHALTTAVVALNPLFVYLSVTTSNDAWAVAGATLLAWSGAWLARHPHARLLTAFGIGCLCGLALLTKYSAGLGALAGLAAYLLLQPDSRPSLSQHLKRGLVFFAGVAATSSAWFGANALAYGELIPLNQAARVMPGLQRAAPLSWQETINSLPGLLTTYWGVFIGTINADVYDSLMGFLCVLGLVGLLIMAISWTRIERQRHAAVLICLVWLSATLASVLLWIRSVGFGGHARLLLVASPAVALLLALGWQQLARSIGAQLPNRPPDWLYQRAMPALLGLFLVLPFLPLPVFMRNYTTPTPLALDAVKMNRVINASYEKGMTIAGVDLPNGPFIAPGKGMPLRLYLKANQGVDGFYTLFIHLVDAVNNRVMHAFDGVPFGGRHPTRQWRAGETFADDFTLALPADFSAEVTSPLRLIAGFYPFGQPDQRLTARDGNGTPIGEEVLLANVRVLAGEAQPSLAISETAPLAEWDNGITLKRCQHPRGCA